MSRPRRGDVDMVVLHQLADLLAAAGQANDCRAERGDEAA